MIVVPPGGSAQGSASMENGNMSIRSRARRVHERLPWRPYQSIHQALQGVRPDEEDALVAAALKHDVPKLTFLEVVHWTRHFGRAREQDPDADRMPWDSESQRERNLREYLEGLPLEVAIRVEALYYAGRDDEDDVVGLYNELAERDEGPVVVLLEKMPLDGCLAEGLAILERLGLDPNGDWHRARPTRHIVRSPTPLSAGTALVMSADDALEYVESVLARVLGVSPDELDETEYSLSSTDPGAREMLALTRLIAILQAPARPRGPRLAADRLADLVQKVATISANDAAVDLDETLRALAAVTPSFGG